MSTSLAVAAPLQGAVVLAAAGAAAAALAFADPRRRAVAVLAAPALAVLAVATVVEDPVADAVGLSARAAGALGAGLAAVAALAWLLHRYPVALAPLAIAALPFRVPVSIGDSAANLLVPLYAVIAAGCLAYAIPRLRRGGAPAAAPPHRRLRRVELAFAAVLVLYALQSLYSTDLAQAVENVGFFYVPFALLFRLLLEVRWSVRLLRDCLALAVGLALLFAAIGFVEFATGHLLITNAKVVEANDLKPYFRVNSLFFDPNIYGRYLALTMTLLAAVLLLWARRRRDVLAIAGALAVLWAGLLFSLSQSSFVALLVGLAVLAALRWSPWPVLGAAAVAAAVAVTVIALAPGAVNLETDSEQALDRATSGRVDLIGGGLEMVADRPVWGFGSGAFAERYRERENVSSEKVATASHTIALTVAAEQGAIGLAAYLVLVGSGFALVFAGLRAAVRARVPASGFVVARAAVAAAYCALILHTLVYAAFLEDPLSWALLAIAATVPLPGPDVADADAATENGAVPRARLAARA